MSHFWFHFFEISHFCDFILGVQTRVVGWYHSHPKITVQPSHVDLRTQVKE